MEIRPEMIHENVVVTDRLDQVESASWAEIFKTSAFIIAFMFVCALPLVLFGVLVMNSSDFAQMKARHLKFVTECEADGVPHNLTWGMTDTSRSDVLFGDEVKLQDVFDARQTWEYALKYPNMFPGGTFDLMTAQIHSCVTHGLGWMSFAILAGSPWMFYGYKRGNELFRSGLTGLLKCGVVLAPCLLFLPNVPSMLMGIGDRTWAWTFYWPFLFCGICMSIAVGTYCTAPPSHKAWRDKVKWVLSLFAPYFLASLLDVFFYSFFPRWYFNDARTQTERLAVSTLLPTIAYGLLLSWQRIIVYRFYNWNKTYAAEHDGKPWMMYPGNVVAPLSIKYALVARLLIVCAVPPTHMLGITLARRLPLFIAACAGEIISLVSLSTARQRDTKLFSVLGLKKLEVKFASSKHKPQLYQLITNSNAPKSDKIVYQYKFKLTDSTGKGFFVDGSIMQICLLTEICWEVFSLILMQFAYMTFELTYFTSDGEGAPIVIGHAVNLLAQLLPEMLFIVLALRIKRIKLDHVVNFFKSQFPYQALCFVLPCAFAFLPFFGTCPSIDYLIVPMAKQMFKWGGN